MQAAQPNRSRRVTLEIHLIDFALHAVLAASPGEGARFKWTRPPLYNKCAAAHHSRPGNPGEASQRYAEQACRTGVPKEMPRGMPHWHAPLEA